MEKQKRIHVIASQHLDVAWLWTRAPYGEELMRQCFERAIEMIEADPGMGFIFSRSTAWSFWVIERKYPKLFEEIRRCVLNGTIELCGGEWIEPDHLIPNGESLVRQCALGQWYFLEKFDRCASVCWDPDIFGHPHSLPQILKKCGLDGFYSHRCRPRDEDENPLHQFIWEGPDGSQVFYLAGTWLRAPRTEEIRNVLKQQSNQDLPAIHVTTGLSSDRRITMQNEWLAVPKQTAKELGLDFCKWSTASEVLADMRTYADKLPTIKGELGFQFTGTYTSNGHNKRTNRHVEELLVSAEKAATWAWTLGFRYPAEQLTHAWRDHCVNQFHDIICGCSVGDVHAEDRELWAAVVRRADFARNEALAYLCDRLAAGLPKTNDGTDTLAVFNLLAWPRSATVEIDLANDETVEVCTANGEKLPVQLVNTNDSRVALIQTPKVAGVGYELLKIRKSFDHENAQRVTRDFVLENNHVRIEIDSATGAIASLISKPTGREYIKEGGLGNRLVFLGDAEKNMPAWNIEYTGQVVETGVPDTMALVESGPVRQTIRVVRTLQLNPQMPATVITQDIMLYACSPIVHFATYGEWHASEIMAKTVFDLAFASETCVSEAPYAAIERKLTTNTIGHTTDADTAAEDAGNPDKGFEKEPDAYMQKWLDIADGKQGMLFLNNGLYGYDAKADQVRLSLLRAPLDPANMLTDVTRPMKRERIGLGPFAFTYGIVAHQGDWKEVNAPQLGSEFNSAMIVRPVRDGFEHSGVWRDWWDMRTSAPQVVPTPFIETLRTDSSMLMVIKRAEDGRGIVLRIVETCGKLDSVVMRYYRSVRSAIETDMLERPLPPSSSESSISISEADIKITMSPWEIKTIRIIAEQDATADADKPRR